MITALAKRAKKLVKAKVEKKMATQEVDAALTEHERYLILLGYQQAAREILRAK